MKTNKILEHDAALTTPYRKSLVEDLKKKYAYVLPKEVGGIFSAYCVNFNQTDRKPYEQAIFYVVKDNAQKKIALERLVPSFECHKYDNFRAYIHKATDDHFENAVEVKPTKTGKVRAIAA